MSINLPTTNPPRNDSSHQKEKIRNCDFPDCGVEFLARGKTKYCDEHRKPEHRSKLYGKAPGETPVFGNDGNYITADNLNRITKHTYSEAQTIEYACDCCGDLYPVTVIPRQYIYPKYCPLHRNEFKRNLYMKTRGLHGKTTEEYSSPVSVSESPCGDIDCPCDN